MATRVNHMHTFLTELDNFLGEYYHSHKFYPDSDLILIFNSLRTTKGLKKTTGSLAYYKYLYDYLGISFTANTYALQRFYCAHYVFIKDISLRNFILSIFADSSHDIIQQPVNMPDHADLKEYAVPIQLVTNAQGKYIFKF